MRKQQRAKAGAEMLPMWECCQFQCCQFPIGDWNWLMRKYGAGRIGLVYYSAKGKLSWRRNADIAVRQAAGTAVHTARLAARVMTGVGV